MDPSHIRNVAIIAHVDHGKTTLVDRLLYTSGMFRPEELDRLAGGQHGLIFDSNPLERERGITILSKNCAIETEVGGERYKINIIDTPGHADFGGEVERVLSMADGAILLVDAFEGPMPQTRFVVEKAIGHGLKPFVVINKADKLESRPDDVLTEVFDLLVSLDAPDEVLDFPVLYASGRDGWCCEEPGGERVGLELLLERIIAHVPPPRVRPEEPLQLRVTTLDHSDFVGRIAIGKVEGGEIRSASPVLVVTPDGATKRERIGELHVFHRLERKKVEVAEAGEIVAVVGIPSIDIGSTITDPDDPRPLTPILVDEPTLHMTFRVNDGPLAGREGEFVTTRQISDRLEKELERNVALRVEPGERPEEYFVSGRGLMHLGILLETMRREGFELTVGMPRVVEKEIDGKRHEPFERLVVECPTECQGLVMALVGERRAELVNMDTKSGASGYLHLEFRIPARGLIGLRNRILTATQGRAITHHTYLEYAPYAGDLPRRTNGALISMENGASTGYALDALYDRGVFFIEPGATVYEGMIVGEHARDNDLNVNVVRTKKLTNIRAAGKDDNTVVRPVRRLTLESALEWVGPDELVEVTPQTIRVRKRILSETERRRESRKARG
ncbi:MAG: translational GTPase TypA [Planctomycetota bacterium]|jgi:GTP-binding protein